MFNHISSSPFAAGKPHLGVFTTLKKKEIKTPSIVHASYIGTPLYTTPDCIADDSQSGSGNVFGQLEISDLVRKDFGNLPLSKLNTEFSYFGTILSSRHVVPNVASTDVKGINIDSFNGRIHISVSDYLNRISLEHPDAVVSFADEVDVTSGRKRLSKSVERSLAWFSEMITSQTLKDQNSFVFGVVIPIPEVPTHVGQYASNLLSRGAKGLVVGCAHMGESEEVRQQSIKGVRSVAGENVPVMIQGADTIRQILMAISSGVDLISTNYPTLVTAKGFAIAFGHKRAAAVDSDVVTSAAKMDHKKRSVFDLASDGALDEDDGDIENPAAKRIKTNNEAPVSSAQLNESGHPKRPKHVQQPPAAASKPVNQHKPIARCSAECDATFERCLMQLWDNSYEKDATPLVAGCKCHACKYHTRAYIHHLLIAKEMLAEVLLYHHNLHQVNAMMEGARQKIGEGQEVFEEWSTSLLSSLQ